MEDARVVKIEDRIYMCYALQPYAFDCYSTGYTLPDYAPEVYPQWKENNTEYMITRSGIAVSLDGKSFEQLCYTTPPEIDDRDNTLFPEKIGGSMQYFEDPCSMWVKHMERLYQVSGFLFGGSAKLVRSPTGGNSGK